MPAESPAHRPKSTEPPSSYLLVSGSNHIYVKEIATGQIEQHLEVHYTVVPVKTGIHAMEIRMDPKRVWDDRLENLKLVLYLVNHCLLRAYAIEQGARHPNQHPLFAMHRLPFISCLLLLLLLTTTAAAQWTNRYPMIFGYSHHVYVEGYELPTLTSGPIDPAASPMGDQLAFSARGWIWLFDLETKEARRVTSGPALDFRPAWSADGTMLAFVRDDGSDTDIVLLNLQTGEEQVAIDENAIDLDPSFSEDGKYMYYSSAVAGGFDVWRLKLENGEKQQVTNATSFERNPRIGSRPNTLYYLKKSFGGDGITRLNFVRDGTDTPLPERNDPDDLMVTWTASQGSFDISPDGTTLAYTWPHEDGYELRILDLRQPVGSVLLTKGEGRPLTPAWSSDGQWIWFAEGTEDESTTLKRISVYGGPVETVPVATWDWGEQPGKLRITTTMNGAPVAARLNVMDEVGHPAVPETGSIRFDGRNGRVFFYTPGVIEIEVPSGRISVAAVHGLLTPEAIQDVLITAGGTAEIELTLDPIWDPSAGNWYAGDHHFHLNYGGPYTLDPEDILLDMKGEAMDVAIPLLANLHNRFFDQHLWQWERPANEPLLVFGQEIRSHFLGHLNLIGTEELYWPWVWGPGYQVYGTDDRTNAQVLDAAHAQGGLGGYVHPVRVKNPFLGSQEISIPFGLVADAVQGKVDLLEIGCLWTNPFGTAEVWHRLLNIGIPVAASAGTDVMNNFYRTMAIGVTRMYVQVDGPLTYPAYLEALKQGRSFVTNGPMLEFEVSGEGPGGVIEAAERASWSLDVHSAVPYDSVTVFVNGSPIWKGRGSSQSGSAYYSGSLDLPSGGWVSVRVHGEDYAWPMMDSYVFAQTSPVWIGSVGSTDPVAFRQAATDLLRALDSADFVVQNGYMGKETPNLEQHFEGARKVLEEMVGED